MQLIRPNRTAAWLALLVGLLAGAWLQAAAPVVSNVRSAQRAGTRVVDIFYDLADADSGSLTVSVAVSTNGGASYRPGPGSFTGALGAGIAPGRNKQITWNSAADLPAQLFANVRVSVPASDVPVPGGLALISAGSFTMGNTFAGEGYGYELPTHPVYVSAFYMDKYEVTEALWDDVCNWAITHGYSFEYGALGKANNRPAQSMTWYDAVKWCNARSEKESKTPAYLHGRGVECAVSGRAGGTVCELEQRLPAADRGGVGEGGAGRCQRPRGARNNARKSECGLVWPGRDAPRIAVKRRVGGAFSCVLCGQLRSAGWTNPPPPRRPAERRRRREENPSAALAPQGANVSSWGLASGRAEAGVARVSSPASSGGGSPPGPTRGETPRELAGGTPAVPWRNRTLADGLPHEPRRWPAPWQVGDHLFPPRR